VDYSSIIKSHSPKVGISLVSYQKGNWQEMLEIRKGSKGQLVYGPAGHDKEFVLDSMQSVSSFK
jgi:hypothetical protein